MSQEWNYKYRTMSVPTLADFRDRGSKFLAFAYPVFSVKEVKDRLHELKKLHPKANHHCFAYRIGLDNNEFRANDDGEPSGSAGKPILGQIDSSGLTNVLIIVVRYFGGTLLGVPGLINAYKTVAADALKQAVVTERWIEDIFNIEFDYPVMGEVMYLLRQAEATVYHQELQLFCSVRAGIPRIHSGAYITRLSELRGVKITKEGN